MAGAGDLKMFAVLLLGLFVIMIIAAVTFIASPYLKSAACTATDSSYAWEEGACQNQSTASLPVNGTNAEVTVLAITQIGIIEAAIILVLSLLTLVVVVLIFQLVVKVAKGFGGGGSF